MIREMLNKQKESDNYLKSVLNDRERDLREMAISFIVANIKTVEECGDKMSQEQINKYLKENIEIAQKYKITKQELIEKEND